ncbi:interleukin-1 receptor accessory protein [Limanda limanda]|uniref:interleukin-1 receptor accessory protein n=1 Tax=Limanda limanda TaxID=27771 RepID=UPI0029C6EF3E|nr:interleukin-1 receptor accessory protein [Limanda limanda]
MSSFVSTLVFLCSLAAGTGSEPMCNDWGESSDGTVSVLEGEAAWLSCPLFSHPSVYNYTSTQSAGHNLVWYRDPEGHDLEQPITYSSRLTRGRERLWLQPASSEDSGLYICMLRNKSSCSKMAVRLKVLRRADLVQPSDCRPPVAAPPSSLELPQGEGATLDCPDLQEVSKMADSVPNVTWYHVTLYGSCYQAPFWHHDRELDGSSLRFFNMFDIFEGLYLCTVSYRRKGEPLNFSRSIDVTTVHPTNLSKYPNIMQPHTGRVFSVRLGTEARLQCEGLFPHLKSEWDIWWTVDGMTLDQLADPRFYNINSHVRTYKGDRTEESLLVIQDFGSKDLNRSYTCSVKNSRGSETRRAELKVEESVSLPSVELGCGLGVTLVLMLLLFVVYHVFWLELLLLYRSWFGSDERHTDDKEYDVYISYARDTEDETFVLSTLRTVLENELGYSVCIFDRDSLPGGTITDETLSFVARSRRVLVVVSPGYATQGSQALLELKAGIDGMALSGDLKVILVQFKPVRWQGWVRELRRARVALALVQWQGDKSSELTSRFWKRLRVELPVRRVGRRAEEEEEEGGGYSKELLRLQSQISTNSQTGLLTDSRTPKKVFSCAV